MNTIPATLEELQMTTQEANYWNEEISNADIDLEADCGDFLFAAIAIINIGVYAAVWRKR